MMRAQLVLIFTERPAGAQGLRVLVGMAVVRASMDADGNLQPGEG
jgi:hypothetical protein